MKRKIIALVMLATMSFSLFGCSSIKDKPEDVTKKEEITKEETTKETKEETIEDTPTNYSVDTAKSDITTSSTATSSEFTFEAAPITWSVSQDGGVSAFYAALSGMHIHGESVSLVSGPGIDIRFEPGDYTITWKLSDGSTVNQYVTITE